MDALYDQLGFLPETMQASIVALLIIIIGYFLSKILAAIVSSIIPAKPTFNEKIAEDNLPLRTRVVRACFWVSWLIFIVIGLNELPSIDVSLPQPPSSPEEWTHLVLVIFYAYLLLLSEKYFAQIYKAFAEFCSSIPLPRDNPVFRYIIRNSWLPILIIFVVGLASPGTLSHKVTITMVIVLGGWLLGNAIKQAIQSIFQNKFLAKFSFYLIIVNALLSAINNWL